MTLYFDINHPRRDFNLNLSGEFTPGITGIYGPSGAGKTSFFSILAGIENLKKGKIYLGDRLLTDTDKKRDTPIHKRRVGIVFQDNLLFPHKTVKENLMFGMRYTLKPKVELKKTIDILKLDKILNSKPHEISGGETQRVAIGRTLLTSPDMLLMDEPFNAIDYELRESILKYIKEISRELNIPILIISHDYNDLRELTDNFYYIDKGRNTLSSRIPTLKSGTD